MSFAGCLTDDPGAGSLSLLGLCDDSQSTYLRGSAAAPGRIREAYNGECFNSSTEWGLDLSGQVLDEGNAQPDGDWASTFRRFENAVGMILENSRIPCLLGGDHAVTVPAVSAFRRLGRPLHVIQFDAHPDLYPDYQGNRYSHACTASRLLEMDFVATLTQIGIRASNPVQQRAAAAHAERLRVVAAGEEFSAAGLLPDIPAGEEIYITLDLDVFDPAFAPGVSHPVPGGLFPRQLLSFLKPPFPWSLIGIDVVEVNPDRDYDNRTAILAGRLLHHAMGLMVEAEGNKMSN